MLKRQKVLSIRYKEKHFKLIVNSVNSCQEADEVHRQLNLVTSKFLNISVEYFGYVLMDKNIKKFIKKQKVITQWAPYTPASIGFAVLAEKIFHSEPPVIVRKSGVLDYCVIPL